MTLISPEQEIQLGLHKVTLSTHQYIDQRDAISWVKPFGRPPSAAIGVTLDAIAAANRDDKRVRLRKKAARGDPPRQGRIVGENSAIHAQIPSRYLKRVEIGRGACRSLDYLLDANVAIKRA